MPRACNPSAEAAAFFGGAGYSSQHSRTSIPDQELVVIQTMQCLLRVIEGFWQAGKYPETHLELKMVGKYSELELPASDARYLACQCPTLSIMDPSLLHRAACCLHLLSLAQAIEKLRHLLEVFHLWMLSNGWQGGELNFLWNSDNGKSGRGRKGRLVQIRLMLVPDLQPGWRL